MTGEGRMNPENRIKALFAEYPDVIYGFSDISYSPYGRQYRSAIVLAVPYGKQLTTETYTEQDFEDGIQSAKARLGSILQRLETLLQACGTAYHIPPVAQSDEIELLAPFSFKYAATRAGIGWIGKNDVVITHRYGPRVRLSAVLTDAPLSFGEPVTGSQCPDDCVLCVEACPCKALHGVRWDASKQRSELIDYQRCNRMRSSFIPELGRKHACGRCLAACPFGKQESAGTPGGRTSMEMIETERLQMRRLLPEDYKAMAAWDMDERVYKYLLGSACRTPEEPLAWLPKKDPASKVNILMLVSAKNDGHAVGIYAVNHDLERDVWTLSYVNRYDDWGKGYTAEGMKALMEHAVKEYGARSFEGECARENTGSRRVMEKLGMVYDHSSSYTKNDGSATFESDVFTLTVEIREV